MQNVVGSREKINDAKKSVASWFNGSRFIQVIKPVNELRDDAYIVKEYLLKENFPDKWKAMNRIFKWRFGVQL